MSQQNASSCVGGPTLIFACSGAADVGEIADRAARQLSREGVGKMFCVVGVGGRVEGILKTAAAARKILAIDGCPLNCVKKSLDLAGLTGFTHLQIAELGLEKGKSAASQENIDKVAAKGRPLLA